MQALILAGGEGTRLRPLTSTVPKPVVPLVDRPFIAFMLDWLRSHGVDDVVMSCGHLASGVRDVLGDGPQRWLYASTMAALVLAAIPLVVRRRAGRWHTFGLVLLGDLNTVGRGYDFWRPEATVGELRRRFSTTLPGRHGCPSQSWPVATAAARARANVDLPAFGRPAIRSTLPEGNRSWTT